MNMKFSVVILAGLLAQSAPAVAQYAQRANQARQTVGSQNSAYQQPAQAPARTAGARYTNSAAAAAAPRAVAPAVAAGAQPSAGATASGARPVASMASLSGMRTGLTAFSADMGRLPTTAEGLAALVRKPAGARNWRGPYVTQGFGPTSNTPNPFNDPWGNPYQYSSSVVGSYPRFEIRSAGPDGILNNADDLAING